VNAGEFTYVSANGSEVGAPAAVDAEAGNGLENVDALINEVAGGTQVQFAPTMEKKADITIVVQ